ncbi:hypothetical protein GF318_02760 [Candidatus Micrarchaeota archaeon]|nr:hypothetical protein [Candidatus Micrarchaeota archaeon]
MLNVTDEIKKMKADRLVSITVAKEKGKNIVFYHLARNDSPEILEYSIKVPKNEQVKSLIDLFENAALYEAEATELFGVKFRGNELSGKRLFQGEGPPIPKTCAFKGAFRVTKDA